MKTLQLFFLTIIGTLFANDDAPAKSPSTKTPKTAGRTDLIQQHLDSLRSTDMTGQDHVILIHVTDSKDQETARKTLTLSFVLDDSMTTGRTLPISGTAKPHNFVQFELKNPSDRGGSSPKLAAAPIASKSWSTKSGGSCDVQFKTLDRGGKGRIILQGILNCKALASVGRSEPAQNFTTPFEVSGMIFF